MYVEITDYKCEGMIRLSNLADDYYEYDEFNQWIIGRRTRKTYQLGGQVMVVVKGADTIKRQIDLDLLDNVGHARVNKKTGKEKNRKTGKLKSGPNNAPKSSKKKRRR
jgi:transcriptional accessory protein Tex/SPT6